MYSKILLIAFTLFKDMKYPVKFKIDAKGEIIEALIQQGRVGKGQKLYSP